MHCLHRTNAAKIAFRRAAVDPPETFLEIEIVQARCSFNRRIAMLALLLASVLGTSVAQAQWAWRDANGQVIFSDRAPPPSVRDSQVIRRPAAGVVLPVLPAPSDAKTETAKADAAEKKVDDDKAKAPPTMAEREAAFRKRLAEREESEKKAADEAKRKQEIAAQCERMRNGLAALEAGQRVVRYTASGEREVIDDTARAAEAQRLRQQIGEHCK